MNGIALTLVGLLALAPADKAPRSGPLDPVGRVHIPIGLADSVDSLKTFVEAEGGFSPGFATYGIACWVLDGEAGTLHAATNGRPVEHGLGGVGRLIPWSKWSADGVEVWSEACQADWSLAGGTGQLVGSRARLTNRGSRTRRLALFVAIRPLGPAGGPIRRLEVAAEGRALLVDGHVALVSEAMPTASGLEPRDTVADAVRAGKLSDARSVTSADGNCSGVLRFDLTLVPGESHNYAFACPVLAGRRAVGHRWDGTNPQAQLDDATPNPASGGVLQPDPDAEEVRAIKVDALFRRAGTYWDDLAGRVTLRLPDRRWAEAFAAIAGHVALAMNEGAPDVAVVNYNVFNRDGIYATSVLQKSGRPDLAERAIEHLLAHPFSGRVEPEADNPGQVLWILGEHWRFTRDRAWLDRVAPAVDRLVALVRYYRTEPGPHWVARSGLGFGPGLPADARLELKPGACDGHHPEYTEAFDVAGLRAAAMLARASGDEGRAKERESLAGTLQGAYDVRFRGRLAAGYGSYCVLWPCRLYPADRGPAHEAFRGVGARPSESWRYFPLATAHQGLLAGRREAGAGTISLHLDHPQMKGWYALDEGGASGAGGWRHARTTWDGSTAMPHGWAVAEFHLLLRDCLAREDGDRLVLLAGIPPAWFTHPEGFGVAGLPTYFGDLAFEYEPGRGGGGTLTLGGKAAPPGGFVLRLADGRDVAIPPGQGEVPIVVPARP